MAGFSLATAFFAPVGSSAARAAHRELRSLLRLFRANYFWDLFARDALAHRA